MHLADEYCMALTRLQIRVFKIGVQLKTRWHKRQLAHTVACFEAHQTVGMASAAEPAGDDILIVNNHLS